MRNAIIATSFLLSLVPTPAPCQATRHWISETTVTWGRGGFAYQGFGTDAVALGDLGLRWSYPYGIGWGVSFTGGYDFPNEASLLGARARITREWSDKRIESSVAGLVSSLDEGYFGATVGLAFYPVAWGALVTQLDFLPTRPPEATGDLDPEVERSPAGSFGVRLGEWAGIASWIGAAVFTGLSLVFLAFY